MLRPLCAVVSAAACIVLGSLTASADWPAGGLLLSQSALGPENVRLFHNPAPDISAVWQDREGSGLDPMASWISADATPHVLFPPLGDYDGELNHGLISINESVPPSVRVVRSLSNGSIAPGLPGMLVVADPSEDGSAICTDGAGGFYVLWKTYSDIAGRAASAPVATAHASPEDASGTGFDLRLNRFQSNGTVAAGWPAQGILVARYDFYIMGIELIGDPDGGVYATWVRFDPDFARVQRITAAGTPAPGWPALGGGLALGPSESVGKVQLVAVDASHHVAVWTDPAAGVVRLQRFGNDGVIDPAWPASGFAAHASGAAFPSYASDGVGGIHAVWNSGSGVARTLHVLANATLPPGYVASGIDPLDPGAVFFSSPTAGIYSARGRDGGVAVLWTDDRGGVRTVRVRWLQADGSADPNEPAGGRVVNPAATTGSARALLDDGTGGVYAAWSQVHSPELSSFLLSYLPNATVSVPPGSSSDLSLAVGPNPARGELSVRFSLGSMDPARVDLVDVAGRRRYSEVATGLGEQVVRFSRLEQLGAGLYFVRVTHAGTTRVARVSILD